MEKIKLAFDVGNTSINIGGFVEKDLVKTVSYLTADFNHSDFEIWVRDFLGNSEVSKIGLSCVVPRYHEAIINTLKTYAPVFVINPENLPNLLIRAENRNELGADFIAAYYGAIIKYPPPIIVFDLGSATKTLVIDENQEIIGVAIKPGMKQILETMLRNIPHLPVIELAEPRDVLGNNTEEAIKAGLFFGELANIHCYGALIEQHYKMGATTVVTGGYSHYFTKYLQGMNHDPDLLLYGINKIIDNEL